MADIFGVSGEYYSVAGLALDAFGVFLLGYDLIHLQSSSKKRAADNINNIEEMSEEYGGIQSWAEDIKKSTRWIDSNEYSRHHAEDEISFNARHTTNQMKELGSCVEGLAEHLSNISLPYLKKMPKTTL